MTGIGKSPLLRTSSRCRLLEFPRYSRAQRGRNHLSQSDREYCHAHCGHGAGGIGAIYGASLATAGADVVFVARGAHVAAMRENGLRIEGDRGDIHIRPAQATDDIASIGLVDYVLFAVKLWDVETAGERSARSSDPKPR